MILKAIALGFVVLTILGGVLFFSLKIFRHFVKRPATTNENTGERKNKLQTESSTV